MAVTLKQLIDAYEDGSMNIEYDSNLEKWNPKSGICVPTQAMIGTQAINAETAVRICQQLLGWTEINCHPFRIIDKTRKFIKGLKNHVPSDVLQSTTMVEFQNKKGPSPAWEQYGKTVDRIIFINNRPSRPFAITVLYGAGGNGWNRYGSKYEVFDYKSSNKITNLGSTKQVGEYISSLE